ncbi:putative Pentatricopeptide repeat-containing protein [Zostera marina]|uniref:Putative Pentatricopeptide repeat-containing protein n=1 Tax=Zostera marina TaxID=29655 RepID=A0A0K9PAI1_ZOSMR|nr:putative Pentatricopeptide repeat-containing protein [Zostera marina]
MKVTLPSYDFKYYGELIQQCSSRRLLLPGKQLHGRLIVASIVPGNYLASKLISLYSNHNLLHESRKVLDAVPEKTIFSINALLIAYSQSRLPSHALRLFSSLPDPDAVSISSVLNCLSSIVGENRVFVVAGYSIHGRVIRLGFERDLFVANGLITMYSRYENLESARKVFDLMPERDVVSWNSMISGYSQSGLYSNCLQLYREMEKNSGDLKPNNITVVSALQACANLKDLDFGTKIHGSLKVYNVKIDTEVWNSVVGLYEKCGKLEYARELFEATPSFLKDEVSYGVMISGYMNHGFVAEAIDIFKNMDRPGLKIWNAVMSGLSLNNQHKDVSDLFREMQLQLTGGFRPNPITLSIVLPTMSFFSDLTGGKQVHGYSVRNYQDGNVYLSVSLIDMYGKTGCLRSARKVFALIIERTTSTVISWTAIISAHAAHGDIESVSRLFSKMIASGIHPDNVTFISVLTACGHAGAVVEANAIFKSMTVDYGIIPTTETYACMVGVMSRAGLLNQALDVIAKMPSSIKPNAKCWGALLNGASIVGDVEIAKTAFDHLAKIEPENDGNFVIMANIYSKAGKWREARKVRNELERLGLGKTPGCSWRTYF